MMGLFNDLVVIISKIWYYDKVLVIEDLRKKANGRDTTIDKRWALRNKMHKYFDDNNCLRILEALGISS